jgi:hypothetical protein
MIFTAKGSKLKKRKEKLFDLSLFKVHKTQGGFMIKKILSLVLVFILALSLTSIAGEQTFELEEVGDWELWDYNGAYERHDQVGNPIELAEGWNYEVGGSNALRVSVVDASDTGFVEPQFTTSQSDFLTDVTHGDTVFYAVYLAEPKNPDNCINVIKVFGKDGSEGWSWRDNGNIWEIPGTSDNLPNDTVKYEQWNLLAYVVDSTGGWVVPPNQIGLCLNFSGENTAENPYKENDTIYVDAITSQGRLPSAPSGIAVVEGNLVLPKTSIGSIKYSLSGTAPVLVEAYDITGRKVLTKAPGFQTAGSYEINTDELATGVYIVKIVAGKTSLTSKLITIK